MNKEDQLDRIRKVLELAKRGVDGEKESAQALLERLMAKYGVTLEELGETGDGSSARERRLRFEDMDDYSLWWHIIVFIREGHKHDYSVDWEHDSGKKSGWVVCNLDQFEFAQVMALHEVLYDALVRSKATMDVRQKSERDEYNKVIKWHQKRIKVLQEERKQLYPRQREEREWLFTSFIIKNKLNVYKKSSETSSSSSGESRGNSQSSSQSKGRTLSEREWDAYLAAMGDSEVADTTLRFGATCLPGGES